MSEAGRVAPPPGRAWPRAAALFFVVMALSVAHPTILVGIPYVVMLAGLPVRRPAAYVVGAVAAVVVLAGVREGLWWTERGWAILLGGWFVALTLRWPQARFLSRALAALAGAGTVAVALLAGSGAWQALDWQVGERMRRGIGAALEAIRLMQEGGTLSPALVTAVYRTAEGQAQLFPALVALASLASLGVAWWLYLRLAQASDQGLAPLREFRFNDHLVWLFIAGLVLAVAGGGEGLRRAGSNAVVFMGALYAVRGAAVVSFFGSGLSLLGTLLLLLGLLFVAPVMLVGALVIGLGDTWLDLRTRARAMTA